MLNNRNLQNLPVKGKYGKLVKSCVKAPIGWLMVGADFSSLEDRIDALLTKDPNKLKVYTDGYDGHCLRAQYYYFDKLGHIDPNSVEEVNSIKEDFPDLRDSSKPITFALTYLGTAYTLQKNCGLDKETALKVEAAYHELYQKSDEYKETRLAQAAKDGYATLAFGLRIRCDLLKSTVYGSKRMTSAAKAEMRTIGNAFGQSYGMLNNYSGIKFQNQTLESKYRLLVHPMIHIHDAQYYLIKDDVEVLHYVNTNVVKHMSWQELPEIKHDQVKLGAELDVFYPTWKDKITLPNGITLEQLNEIGATLDV